MNKIKIGFLGVFLLLCFNSMRVVAEVGYVKGVVKNIRTHDADLPGWEPPIFWFTLEGVSGKGACTDWHGNTLFVGNSDQTLSLVLATYAGGKELAVRYDDSKKINGHCKAEYVTLGSPAPTH